MSANGTTKEQVVLDLQRKISQILSIPVSDIDKSESFWDLFPPGYRYEPKQMTEFVEFVSDAYRVYLSERQWDSPSLSKLADYILERQADPQSMLAQIRKDRAKWKNGLTMSLISFPVMFGLCGTVLFLTESSPAAKLRALFVCLGCTLFAETTVLFLAYRENRKFEAEVRPVLKYYNTDL